LEFHRNRTPDLSYLKRQSNHSATSAKCYGCKVCTKRCVGGILMEMEMVKARIKVLNSIQNIFNNHKGLNAAMEGSGGMVKMGGDDDLLQRQTQHVSSDQCCPLSRTRRLWYDDCWWHWIPFCHICRHPQWLMVAGVWQWQRNCRPCLMMVA
jgi:hypothetical protein